MHWISHKWTAFLKLAARVDGSGMFCWNCEDLVDAITIVAVVIV